MSFEETTPYHQASAATRSTRKHLPKLDRLAESQRMRLILLSAALCAALDPTVVAAQPATAKIVGVGATSCVKFIANINENPSTQRDYLAWAQGFMSATLLSRPTGVDVGLDLNPPNFGLIKQLEFLRQHCLTNRSHHFSDAVVELYKLLRVQAAQR